MNGVIEWRWMVPPILPQDSKSFIFLNITQNHITSAVNQAFS